MYYRNFQPFLRLFSKRDIKTVFNKKDSFLSLGFGELLKIFKVDENMEAFTQDDRIKKQAFFKVERGTFKLTLEKWHSKLAIWELASF